MNMTRVYPQLKPHLLVIVQAAHDMAQEGYYRHVAELISYETGDGTIMARMVPGDPTTMQEIPIDCIRRLTWRPKWVHYAATEHAG